MSLVKNVVSTGGTDSLVNVRTFGARGDGVTDDTTAINAARAASPTLYLPPGNYVYSGTGIEGAGLNLTGAGAGSGITVVTLAAGASFVSAASAVHRMHIEGIRFEGGFGAIRITPTVASVQNWLVVERCEFYNYTGAAISSLSTDQPYWRIRECVFRAVNDTSATFGIVLAGDNAQSVIDSNAFLTNRVHIKFGQNGVGTAAGAIKVQNNDFIRFNAGGTVPRTDLWIVPITGQGDALFLCAGNKFGNENLDTSDYRVLYADEDTSSGSAASSRLPLLSASTGNAAGHLYIGNGQASRSGHTPAFITSYTASLRAQSVSHHVLSSTLPSSIINVIPTPPGGMDMAQISSSVVGPLINHDLGVNFDPTAILACTKPGYVAVDDPAGVFQQTDQPLLHPGGGSSVGFVNLTGTQQAASLNVVSNATLAGITDALGGTNAATLTVTSANGSIYASLTGMVIGQPVWVEFDARTGGGTPAQSAICFAMASGTRKWYRRFPLSSVWRRYRFLHRPTDVSNQLGFALHGTATGTIQFGRVRAYHASEPLLDPGVLPSSTPRDIREYTSAGTTSGITTPTGILGGYVTVISGGGGGGSGRRGAAATVRCGGGGGGVGLVSEAWVPAALWGGTYTVVVGAGGTGGAAVTANDTNGNNGGTGGISSVATGSVGVRTSTPGGGGGGTAAAGTGGGAAVATSSATGGAASGTGGAGGAGSAGALGSGSGGAGGGITSGDSASAGGAGGNLSNWSPSGSGGGSAGAVDGTSPTAGTALGSSLPGGGGGGGAASITTIAQTGAAGGAYGGGGGGGGGSLNGNNSGAGGNGAAGYVRVTFIYN